MQAKTSEGRDEFTDCSLGEDASPAWNDTTIITQVPSETIVNLCDSNVEKNVILNNLDNVVNKLNSVSNNGES